MQKRKILSSKKFLVRNFVKSTSRTVYLRSDHHDRSLKIFLLRDTPDFFLQ